MIILPFIDSSSIVDTPGNIGGLAGCGLPISIFFFFGAGIA
jgi:hypothetical protein